MFKKFLSVILVFMSIILFYGCSDTNNKNETINKEMPEGKCESGKCGKDM